MPASDSLITVNVERRNTSDSRYNATPTTVFTGVICARYCSHDCGAHEYQISRFKL